MLFAASSAASASDLPPADGKPLSAILQSVESRNVGAITSAEFDDGLWEIKTRSGQSATKLYLDPRSGEEKRQRPTEAHEEAPPSGSKPLSVIVAGLEEKQVGTITEVEFEEGFWEVEVRRDGKKRKLEITPQTGERRR